MRSGILIVTSLVLSIESQSSAFATSYSLISRTKATQRTLATAIESYFVDQERYPLPDDGQYSCASCLTTPVSYVDPESLDDPIKINLVEHSNSFSLYLSRMGFWKFATVASIIFALLVFWGLYRKQKNLIGTGCLGFAGLCFSVLIISMNFISGPPMVIHTPNPNWDRKRKAFNYYSDGKSGWVLQGVGPKEVRKLEDLSEIPLQSPNVREEESDPEYRLYIESCYDPTNGQISVGDVFRLKQ